MPVVPMSVVMVPVAGMVVVIVVMVVTVVAVAVRHALFSLRKVNICLPV
jgi:hypothetical protein